MSEVDDDAPRHPIRIVARRTGLSQDLIRAWERRYDAVRPRRSDTNRRLYSDGDVARLRLLGRAVAGGRRIGEIAALPTTELERLVSSDREAEREALPQRTDPSAPEAQRDHLAACLEAVEALDAARLEQALSRAAVDLSIPRMIEQLLVPLLHEVGAAWREGRMRIGHEHLMSSLLRSFLGGLSSRRAMADALAEVVVATPAGERHELGAMMAVLFAVLDGWKVTYLGPDLPAEDIAAAAGSRGARLVALSIVHAGGGRALGDELRRLRRMLPAEVVLVVGGAGAEVCDEALREIGAVRVGDYTDFRAELDRALA